MSDQAIPMSPPPRPLPALLDELVEEALLRVPPDDPASLVRASLVCKLWHRLVSCRRFRRRYREFHRSSPPMLGFFYHTSPRATRFTPTSSFRLPRGDRSSWHAMDARHGRVVFHAPWTVPLRGVVMSPVMRDLVVSIPVTGEERRLPMPFLAHLTGTWNAAVVCAAAGCVHLDCPGDGPFTIVFVCTHVSDRLTSVCTFSSKTGAWCENVSVAHPEGYVAHVTALVGNTLYFILRLCNQILEFDLGSQELSVISPPSFPQMTEWADPFTTEDGRLGIAMFDEPNKLYLWSSEAGPHGHAEWVQKRVFELDQLLPVGSSQISPLYCGAVDNSCVIFVGTRDGLFSIDLKSGRVTKLLGDYDICDIVPYMSFCTPTSLQANKLLMEDEVRTL